MMFIVYIAVFLLMMILLAAAYRIHLPGELTKLLESERIRASPQKTDKGKKQNHENDEKKDTPVKKSLIEKSFSSFIKKASMGIWFKMGCLSESSPFWRARLRKFVYPPGTMKAMKTLFPGKDPGMMTALTVAGNIERFLMILTGVLLLCIMVSVSSMMNSSIDSEGNIERSGYGGAEKVFIADADVGEYQEYEALEIKISARRYGTEELEAFFEELASGIDSAILGENDSVDRVEKPLKLPDSFPGYPFKITWESSDYRYLQHDGGLGREAPEEAGHLITLTATFQYDEYVNSLSIPIMLFPQKIDPETQKKTEFIEFINEAERDGRTGGSFHIPSTYAGEAVVWKERKQDDSVIFLLLGLLAAMALSGLSSQEIKQEMENRIKQMAYDYPSIVSKLTLYMGAGLSLRKSLEKIVHDYSGMNERHYAYDEISYTCNAMASGVLESKALEDLGSRSGHSSYIKMAALLVQNLSKGGNDLFIRLEKEAEDAFQERKNLARKAGEEAGTRLLFPMLIMMCVVMVMILVPAFIGFSG